MKQKHLNYLVLGAFLLILSGCGGDAPNSNPNFNNLEGTDLGSQAGYPKLKPQLISVSGSLNPSGDALIVASGKFGSVYSESGTNFAGTSLRLSLSQGNYKQEFTLLIENDGSNLMGFNSDSSGNPKNPALNFGSIDKTQTIDYVLLFGDIPLLVGNFYIQ